MPIWLLNKLVYTAKKIAFSLKEKQKMTIDDYVLEHILFYHDLAGSHQENNKEARIVKADIKEALERKNATELALALKLAPSLWEEQLKNIITDLTGEQSQLLGNLLLSSNKNSSGFDEEAFALNHDDWRVRANAANILAFLKFKEAIPALIATLASDITGNTMSFCYVAYALGKLQGPEAKRTLEEQLANDEAWLRVDAAGALSYFAFSEVAQPLANALLHEQEALDYMAYAVSNKIKPAEFLHSASKQEIWGGCRLIVGIIQAAMNSFSSKLILDTESNLCLPYLADLAQHNAADPIVIDTALDLYNALFKLRDINIADYASIFVLSDLEKQEAVIKKISDTDSFKNKVLNIIEEAINRKASQNVQLISALRLAGKLNISQAQPALNRLLSDCSNNLSANEIIATIISISQLSNQKEENTNLLIQFAENLVKIDDRIHLNKNKQPVFEENAQETKIYWEILKALGNLATDNAVLFLVRILDDYAPDIRSRALESIIEICEKNSQVKLPKPITEVLQNAFKDPSTMMQLAGLVGTTKLNQVALISDILPLINVQENTVSKEAICSLAYFAQNGYETDVKTVLNEKIKNIREEHKRQRILDILQKH